MRRVVFGIGGGSDFYSSLLLAEDDDTCILTALGPVISDGKLDVTASMDKYCKGNTPDYQFSPLFSSGSKYVLKDSRRPSSFGVLTVPKKYGEEFIACAHEVRRLIGENASFLAVDTGGDCLRGLVDGMGDTDLSDLFGGCIDSRDTDSIALLKWFHSSPINLVVFGPGSDGETSANGLATAWKVLEGGGSYPTVQLREISDIRKYEMRFRSIPQWSNPRPGSTIANIVSAIANVPDVCPIPVIRRHNTITNTIPARFLRSIWTLSIG